MQIPFFRFRYHQHQNGMCVLSVEQPDFMMVSIAVVSFQKREDIGQEMILPSSSSFVSS